MTVDQAITQFRTNLQQIIDNIDATTPSLGGASDPAVRQAIFAARQERRKATRILARLRSA
jgi:hypothetical protein